MGETTSTFNADNDSHVILARPFYNLTLDAQDADLVVFPAFTTGGISVSNTTRVGGGDIFLRRLLLREDCRRLDLIAGYQFAKIDSDLLIASNRRSIRQEGSIPFGTVIQMYDLFDTSNRYNAGEIGFLGEYDRGDITWSLLAKIGLGSMKQTTRDRWRYDDGHPRATCDRDQPGPARLGDQQRGLRTEQVHGLSGAATDRGLPPERVPST